MLQRMKRFVPGITLLWRRSYAMTLSLMPHMPYANKWFCPEGADCEGCWSL